MKMTGGAYINAWNDLPEKMSWSQKGRKHVQCSNQGNWTKKVNSPNKVAFQRVTANKIFYNIVKPPYFYKETRKWSYNCN